MKDIENFKGKLGHYLVYGLLDGEPMFIEASYHHGKWTACIPDNGDTGFIDYPVKVLLWDKLPNITSGTDEKLFWEYREDYKESY